MDPASAAAAPAPSGESISLWFRNIADAVSVGRMKDWLSEWRDAITDVYLPKDYATGRRKGFGFVKVNSRPAADAIMAAKNNAELEGRIISIELAKESRKSSDEMRRRDGDAPPRGRDSRGPPGPPPPGYYRDPYRPPYRGDDYYSRGYDRYDRRGYSPDRYDRRSDRDDRRRGYSPDRYDRRGYSPDRYDRRNDRDDRRRGYSPDRYERRPSDRDERRGRSRSPERRRPASRSRSPRPHREEAAPAPAPAAEEAPRDL